MAQHKQLTWTELRVGLFVLAGAVLLVVVIFYVTGAAARWAEISPARVSARGGRLDRGSAGARGRSRRRQRGEDCHCRAETRPADRKRTGASKSICAFRKAFRIISARTPSAGLITEGLLGNRYVDIDRGFVGRVLQNDEEIPGREEKA